MQVALNSLPDRPRATAQIMHIRVSAQAAQDMGEATAVQLLKAAMQICSDRAVQPDTADQCISCVTVLRAMGHLPTPAVKELQLLGLQLGVPAGCWDNLCSSLSAHRLSKKQQWALLKAAVPAGVQCSQQQLYSCTYLNTCCSMWPGLASQLTEGGAIKGLYEAAIQQLTRRSGPTLVVKQLSGQRSNCQRVFEKAANDLPVSTVISLLDAALEVCGTQHVTRAAAESCLTRILHSRQPPS